MAQETIGAAPKNAIAVIEKDITDVVLKRIDGLVTGKQLMLPKNYSAENALKEAFLIIKKTTNKDNKPALEVCTKDSIANSLLDMCIQGLNPVKKQAYFIVYGKELQLQRSYFGTERALKNVIPSVVKVPVQVIYEGDEIEYEINTNPLEADKIGERIVTKHVQKLENMNNRIIGVYGYIVAERNGKPFVMASDMMTSREVFASWGKSKMSPFDANGNLRAGTTHAQFPVEMTKKTLIGRICKRAINTTDDEFLYNEARKSFVRTTENEYQGDDEIDGEFEQMPNTEPEPEAEASPVQETQASNPPVDQPKPESKGGLAAMFS